MTQKQWKIIYDVDDTLWGLTDVVYERQGLTRQDAIAYDITDNPRLTPQQKQAIRQDFRNPDTFKRCQFYRGYKRIYDIHKAAWQRYIYPAEI